MKVGQAHHCRRDAEVITDRNDLDDQLFDTFAVSVQSAIETLQAQGWAYVNGKDILPKGMFTKPSSRFSKRKSKPQLAQGLPPKTLVHSLQLEPNICLSLTGLNTKAMASASSNWRGCSS